MPWLEIHATAFSAQVATLSDQLMLLGAEAVTLKDAGDQPIYEPSDTHPRIWQETIVVGLFDHQQDMPPILSYLENQQTEGLLTHVELKKVADEDWVRRSLDSFSPICFGKRLWICPSWLTPPDPDAVNIRLDPGLAFGTGTHPTTALCLEWLDQHLHATSYVIDYGCGSGILALAALKLGAKRVLAVDNDPQALEATQYNAEQNAVSPSELKLTFPDTVSKEQADLVIANILAQPLIDMAPQLAQLVKSQGNIVLSGILIEQVPAIIGAYKAFFDMQPPVYKGEWARLVGERKICNNDIAQTTINSV